MSAHRPKIPWPDQATFWPPFTVPDLPGRPMPDLDAWPAFPMPWDDNLPGPTDMSRLLHRPAGVKGFIRIIDGHLATEEGERWRIWGQNLTTSAPLPPMHMAPVIARRLAKFGINCVRLHHIDHRWPDGILIRSGSGKPAPGIIVDGVAGRDQESTRALDPEAMARLDWFIACCKRNGIYIDLNLNVSRPFTVADGVKQVKWIGFGKALTYFDEQLILLQKEYTSHLLEHFNSFTGTRYADEPAIAIIELLNENSLLDYWAGRDSLRGEGRRPIAEVGDIPPAYAKELDRRWNAALAARYQDRHALYIAWEGDLGDYEDPLLGSVRRLRWADFSSASPQRFREEAAFYAQIERDFFLDMQAHLRSLGARQLIVGTSNFHHTWSSLPMLETNATLDVMDAHTYWQHPRFPSSGWARADWVIQNSPMVDDPDHASPTQLSRSAVEGRPLIASELNEPFPNDYAAEFIPIVAAYALLQDWDGLFWFAYGGGTEMQWKNGAIRSFFDMANDPVKMAETAIGALVFLRGDVRAAQKTIRRRYPHNYVLDSLRMQMPDDSQRPYWQPHQYDEGHPYWLPYLPGRLSLVHRTLISSFDAQELSPLPGEVDLPSGRIVSDTRELNWEQVPDDGRVLI
ncbi:MAG: hypothetical protein JXA14_09575, partial [Anaerolineae bacterium]|nr:hypothetical protein [Anaerolineae bacterium]